MDRLADGSLDVDPVVAVRPEGVEDLASQRPAEPVALRGRARLLGKRGGRSGKKRESYARDDTDRRTRAQL